MIFGIEKATALRASLFASNRILMKFSIFSIDNSLNFVYTIIDASDRYGRSSDFHSVCSTKRLCRFFFVLKYSYAALVFELGDERFVLHERVQHNLILFYAFRKDFEQGVEKRLVVLLEEIFLVAMHYKRAD